VWYYTSIKRLGASVSAIFTNLVPVFGVLISVVVGVLSFGPIFGLPVALSFGLHFGLVFGLFGVLGGVLCFGLLFGLVGGLSSDRIAATTRPNEGIHRSFLNAGCVGLVGGLAGGLVGGLLLTLICGLIFGLTGGLLLTLDSGLLLALGSGLFFGLSFGFDYGGRAVLQHYTLRLLLWRLNLLPLNLVPFLDACADRILLRRVGGGYIFVHRLLMEHLAPMTPERAAQLVGEEKDTG